jgi:Mce-associated membrane protein
MSADRRDEAAPVEDVDGAQEAPTEDKADDDAIHGSDHDVTTDAAADADAEPDEAEQKDKMGQKRMRLRSWLARVTPARIVAVIIVLASLSTAGWQWRRARTLNHRVSRQTLVAHTASDFAQGLLSYDYHDLARSKAQVLAGSTTQFGEDYSQAFDGVLGAAISELHAVAHAQVVTVYVGSVTEDHAKAVVMLNQQVKSKKGTRKVVGTYLDLVMLRQGGEWRVDTVVSLGAASQEGGDSNGQPNGQPSSPTTAAPPESGPTSSIAPNGPP